MDRNIVYPGSIPLDTDLLAVNRNAMVAIGALIGAVLGTGQVVDGLVVSPAIPASMAVTVAPGSITQMGPLDQTSYGSLGADASPVMKMGINTAAQSFVLVAPAVAGQSIVYLIQATFGENDDSAIVLPYFNAANPSQAYLGPNNSGNGQVTRRRQSVQLQLKAGAAAVTGSQTPPPLDAGWVGLATVVVSSGQSQVTMAQISPISTSATLVWKLPALRPGFSSLVSFNSSGTFVVPAGVTRAKVTVVGGGGAGGTHATLAGAGGGAGGQAVKIVTGLIPGSLVAVTVGAGGVQSNSAGSGGNGGTSSFGSYVSATGGGGGIGGAAPVVSAGAVGGIGVGGDLNLSGAYGTDGDNVAGRGGDGGGPGNGRGSTGPIAALPAPGYGGGGGGGGSTAAGAPGGGGFVVIEY